MVWYFEALAEPRNFLASLGNIDNVYLFFDFKVCNADAELSGIVSIGKSRQAFLAEFQRFRQQHGYDFIFVNETQQILLSARPEILTRQGELAQLSSLPWYKDPMPGSNQSLNNFATIYGDHLTGGRI